MNPKVFGLAVFIAAAYVGWPNLAKPLGIKPGLVAVIIVAVAMVVVLATSYKDISSVSTISAKGLIILLLVGLANGLAIYLFAKISADKQIQTSIFLVTVFVMEVTLAPVIDWLATGAKPTNLQYVGLALAVPALILLSQRPPQ